MSTLASAQSAEKILAQHIAALGGGKSLKSLAAVKYHGQAHDAATGDVASFTLNTQAPNLIYIELAGGGNGFSEADNGKSGWRRDSVQGLRTLSGPESKQLRATGFFLSNHFLNYKKEKWSPAYLGRETVDGRAADVIEMTNGSSELAGAKCKFYFDAATHLLLRQTQAGEGVAGDAMSDASYSDYRPVRGVPEAYHMTLHQGARTLDIVLDEITHNSSAAPHVFDYPEAIGAGQPDVAKLLSELNKHQNDLNKLRRTYSCTLDETEQDVDGAGKIKKTTLETYYVFYLGRRRFQKHIATNGQPLSPKEQAKEDERINKEQKQAAERQAQAKARRDAAAANGAPAGNGSGSPNNGDGDMVRAVLNVMQFFNFRREPFRGQEVLVFDFSPKPNYKPHGMSETLVSKLIGTMWVDEKDHQVARIQARSSGAFKIAGGLVASLDSGSSIILEQEKVNNEVWLPVLEEIHVSAHLLLLKSERANEINRFSDYKKFTVGSTVTFGAEIPH